MELKRFEDARNAFGRAVDADPDFAAAHYNLSFVLSQLGDFDGALRETRRALELEPLYVPQKFALTIDLQYEDPTIAIAPELVGRRERRRARRASSASTRRRSIGSSTSWRRPHAGAAPPSRAGRLARPGPRLHRQGPARPGHGRAEPGRRPRCAREHATAVLLGDIFAKRGLYGEALERYREARATGPDDPDATLGEIRALLALGWAEDAAPLADELAAPGARRCRRAGRPGPGSAGGG